jgi:hypothetical protein
MSHIVFSNNASALLAASINSSELSIQVAAGYGALFPSPGAGESFFCTLEDNAGNIEIVQCTSRATDILTVVRAQEGTLGQAFTLTVTRVELRLTKATMEEMLQLDGGTLTGDLDLNTNSLLDAFISGSQTRFTQGQIIGVPLRGLLDTATNEIAVPTDGTSRATVGGLSILASGDDIMAELDDAGIITFDSAVTGVEVPAGAYFRVEGATAANHMQILHDDTDCAITFPNTGEVTWDTDLVMAATIKMAGNEIQFVSLVDFSLKQQTVSGIATTVVDYELGSYITLNLTVDIGTLTLDNPPAVDVGVFRFKIIQDSTPRSITWPAGTLWPKGGIEPVLSTAEDAIDYVDLWTDDGGTTWYGAANVNWA